MTDNRIAEINKRLQEIECARLVLANELKSLQIEVIHSHPRGKPMLASPPRTTDAKLALFLTLFRCREDVYPNFWENQRTGVSGYSPACKNEWKNGLCGKPKIKCATCPNRSFIPFTETVARNHLEGATRIGTYAIRTDDTCTFLVADSVGT